MKKNAVQAALLVAGLAVCVLLCGVARDRGFWGAQGAGAVPPVASAPPPPAQQTPQPQPEEEALPPTMTLRRGSIERVAVADGVVQSTTRQDVNTSLTKRVVAVLVQEGGYVNAGDALCQLDTAELDKDIEAAQAGIARAESSDALKLAQAERKLAQLQQALADDEARQATALQEALDALEAAKRKIATDTADSEVSREPLEAARVRVEEKDKELKLTPEFLPDGLTPNPDYQVKLDAYNAAVQAQLNVIAIYDATWDNVYNRVYSTCRPTAETAAYEQALAQWDNTLRQDQQGIRDAQNTVETCRIADSAATYRATLEKKQVERAQYTLTAPISGTVTAVGARVGNTPGNRQGDALFTIQNTGSLVVEAEVPEEDAVHFRVGMPVTILPGALDGQAWDGAVSAISPVADNARFTVTVRFAGSAGRLAAGMTAEVQALLDAKQDVFTVPHSALAQDADGQTVIYAAGQPGEEFRAIPVQTGIEGRRKVEVEGEGLAEGLVVLTSPPESGPGDSSAAS